MNNVWCVQLVCKAIIYYDRILSCSLAMHNNCTSFVGCSFFFLAVPTSTEQVEKIQPSKRDINVTSAMTE